MKRQANNQKYVLVLGFLLFFMGLGYLSDKISAPTGLAIYGSGTEVQLNIWINASNIDQIHTNEQITFFANFTNKTDDSPLNLSIHEDMNCTFMENATGTEINMTFDELSNLSSVNISFSTPGTYSYNITCHANDSYSFEDLFLEESFIITNCNIPSTGDWLIENGSNVICENVNAEINGSINVTDYSNLTLINSSFTDTVIADVTVRNGSSFKIENSSLVLFSELLLSNSSLELMNSSVQASSMNISDAGLNLTNSSMNSIINSFNSQLTFQNSSLDSSGPINIHAFNSSIFMFGLNCPNQIELTNSTNLLAIQSNFTPSLYVSEEINLENISDDAFSTVYLDSSNFKINFSNTFTTATTIVSYAPLNLSNSRINRLVFYEPINVNSLNVLTIIAAYSNLTADNLTSTYLNVSSNSVVMLNRSSAGIVAVSAGSNLSVESSSVYNLTGTSDVNSLDSTFNLTDISNSNLSGQNISIIEYLSLSNSVATLNQSSAGIISVSAESNLTIESSSAYNLTSASDVNSIDSTFNITDISSSVLLGQNITVLEYLSLSNSVANLSGTIARFSEFGTGDILMRGFFTIAQKTISSFIDANITRIYSIYIYNESSQLNGSINITYGDNMLWEGNLTDSYAEMNLTFNSTTYTEQYNINTPIGYVGKIGLLENTPINKTSAVARIALDARLLTPNGTLLNDTAYLNITSNKPLACMYSDGLGNYTAVKVAGNVKIFNGTYLRYNDTLSMAHGLFNNSDLSFTFAGGVYSESIGTNDNDAVYTEELYLGEGENPGRIIFTGDAGTPDNYEDAAPFVYFGNDAGTEFMYSYLLKFNGSIAYNNFSADTARTDLLGSQIVMQGITFNITALDVLDDAGNQLTNMTLSANNISWNIIDSENMKINGSYVSTVKSHLIGTAGRWTGINITYTPVNNVFIGTGESHTDPVFNQFKVALTTINRGNTESMTFITSGLTAEFKFTNNNNTLITIPYYLNTSGVPVRGYNSTMPILIVGEEYNVSIEGQQTGMMFFFITNASRASILSLTGIDTTNHELNMTDLIYGENYTEISYTNSPDTLNQITIVDGSNITLNISADQKTIYYQDAPRTSAKTKYGADISFNESQVIFNENNKSNNNVSIALTPSYDFIKGILVTYDTTSVLNRANKINQSNIIKLANTRYGTIIEDDNQNQNYTIISYPQNQTLFDVRIAGVLADITSTAIQSTYNTSSTHGANNLSLTCTDGVETVRFNSQVNISAEPVISSLKTTTTTSKASINLSANMPITSILEYGDTDNNTMPFSTSNSSAATQHSYVLNSLSSGTIFYYNITICNIYGRCTTNGPYSFTTLSPTTTPPIERWNYINAAMVANADPFANRRFTDLKQGQVYSADISYIQVAVSKVEFVTKKDIKDITFTFARIKNLTEAPRLSDESKVHSYLRFNITQASFDDISKVKVTFRIDKDWFKTNNVSKDAMTLNRYFGQWTELATQYEREDDFYQYYTADIPGFSVFAITATKGSLPKEAAVESSPVQTNTTTTPSTPTTPTIPIQEDTAQTQNNNQDSYNAPQEESPQQINLADQLAALTKNSLFVPAAIGLLALLLIGGGVAVARRPKSMVQELARKQMTNQEVISELKAKGVYGQSLEELRQFIAASLHQGKNSNEIKAALLSVGWEEHIVDDVFQLFNVH